VGEGLRYEANILMWIPFGREFLAAETLVGVRGPLSNEVEVFALGGMGFGDTLGNPDFRLMLGMAYGGAPNRCVAGGKHTPGQCPDLDDDSDNVKNSEDACPTEGGTVDARGCPLKDEDKDGIEDAADKCPAEPETINGVKDDDGCPDEGRSKVRLEGTRIAILDKVYFATNKDVILPKSFDLLKQVSAVLRANPQLERVRVEGHTDSQGADAKNQDLSQRRANSVRKRLIEQEGIAPERLEAVGYGETKPVDTNATSKGRENNRRVEFLILETKSVEVEKEAP